MAEVVGAVRVARGPERVDRAPDRAIPERVLVHLEAERVELRDRFAEHVVADEQDPAVVLVPEPPLVRIQHRGRARFGAAVEHDLDGRRVDVAATPPRPLVHEPVDLLHPSMPVPPERRHDPGRELAPVVGSPVRLEDVRLDPRVLPSGDPDRVELALRDAERRLPVLDGGTRHDLRPEGVRGALLEAPGR